MAYADSPVTLIAGGHDRGIDHAPLVEYLAVHPARIICLGPTGAKLHAALAGRQDLYRAATMAQAVSLAQAHTPPGGVILLSPAASSYGMFRDFIARGEAFATAAGFAASA